LRYLNSNKILVLLLGTMLLLGMVLFQYPGLLDAILGSATPYYEYKLYDIVNEKYIKLSSIKGNKLIIFFDSRDYGYIDVVDTLNQIRSTISTKNIKVIFVDIGGNITGLIQVINSDYRMMFYRWVYDTDSMHKKMNLIDISSVPIYFIPKDSWDYYLVGDRGVAPEILEDNVLNYLG